MFSPQLEQIWTGMTHARAPRPCPLQHRVTAHVTPSPALSAAPHHHHQQQQQRCPRAPRSATRKAAPPASPSTATTRPAAASSPQTTRGETRRVCATGAITVQKISDRARCACADERMNPVEKQRDDKQWDELAWMECVCVCVCARACARYSCVYVSAPVCGQRSGHIWWLMCCFTPQYGCFSRLFGEIVGLYS